MDSSASSSSSLTKISHLLIAICVMVFVACSSADGQVLANVTAGGFTFEVNLSNPAVIEELNIKRSDFPSDFMFGPATAAAQTEGSANEGGRGPSGWDHRVKILPDTVHDSEKFSMAIDGYRRYKEDIKLIKLLGVNSYRFSISWSRILPNGSLRGGINQEGVDHYNSLINKLIKNGIEPFVTIYHFDMPQALEDKYGGCKNRMFVEDFKDYAELCFKLFGDRVKHWFTMNEPRIVAAFGYEVGISPPGRCSIPEDVCALGPPPPGKCLIRVHSCIFGNSSTEPYIVAHNLILAHATVVKLYREKYQADQKGEIGIVLVTQYFVPYSDSKEDKAAAQQLFDFYLGWFMDPFVYGDYPKSMRKLVKERLPTFSAQEKRLVMGSLDFVGINYYRSNYAKHKPPPPAEKLRYSFDSWAEEIDFKEGDFPGASSNSWPEGLQKLMEYVKEKYRNPKIYITENGLSQPRNDTLPLDVQLKDSDRISYIVRHLYRLNKAIKNGVNVKGYFCWSAFDGFEWGMGLMHRYGLYYVDFDDYNRIPKLSAKWFHGFLQGNKSPAS